MPDEPVELDLFPLGAVLFPSQPIPLQIFEPRYLSLMRELRAVIEQTPAPELLGLSGALLAGHNPLALQEVLERPANQIVSALTRIVDSLKSA